VVPFFARDFAGFATDAHSRIREETNLNVVAHVSVPALVRAMCAFADHENQIRKAGTQENTAQEGRFIWAK
jgi:mannose/fructose-specific phosphotransferase system component IIA